MGDSYSSGEGVAPYDYPTDQDSDHKCHRSAGAWPRLIGVSQAHHIACSGAVIVNIDGGGITHTPPDNVDQLGQLGQIAQQTAIGRVVMTIGGNDMKFASRLRNCYLAGRVGHPENCLADVDRVDGAFKALRTKLAATYASVVRVAGAPLLAVGYPDLFPAPGRRAQNHCPWLYPSMQKRADRFSQKLDAALAGAATDAGVDYVSMRDVLSGHELCTGKSYIRAIGGKPGDVTGDQQQAHPLKEGQVLMALQVLRWMKDHRPACTPASSVAAIVDDSGSMADSDPENIRRRALELLLTKPTNQTRTFGAVEFGSDAGILFGPGLVGPNQAAMLNSLDALRDDGFDGGDGTDYNAAFAASADLQPSPGARIFLTDGRHNAGLYENGHVGGPPTYVIGLNIGPDDGNEEAATLLGRIASETGGAYLPLRLSDSDSPAVQESRLQPALNEIDTRIGCAVVQAENTMTIDAPSRSTPAVRTLFDGQAGMEIVASWADPQAQIELRSITVRDRLGRVIADLTGVKHVANTKRRRSQLVLSTIKGQTFDTITVKRPPYGRMLAVTLTASVLPAPTLVTIQIRPVQSAPTSTGVTEVTPATTPPQTTTPTTSTQPTTTTNPPPRVRVNAYDNYGNGAAGHAMCRGNPGNAASTPGGTVSQTFTVSAGVASIDTALVQIDPDSSVTAHATLSVNGSAKATADAAAAGDTTLSFPSVAVNPGDSVMLSISFTATSGKIITVYTVGNPGGTFTATNSCSAGAPNVSTTTTGLRAVLSGYNT